MGRLTHYGIFPLPRTTSPCQTPSVKPPANFLALMPVPSAILDTASSQPVQKLLRINLLPKSCCSALAYPPHGSMPPLKIGRSSRASVGLNFPPPSLLSPVLLRSEEHTSSFLVAKKKVTGLKPI